MLVKDKWVYRLQQTKEKHDEESGSNLRLHIYAFSFQIGRCIYFIRQLTNWD